MNKWWLNGILMGFTPLVMTNSLLLNMSWMICQWADFSMENHGTVHHFFHLDRIIAPGSSRKTEKEWIAACWKKWVDFSWENRNTGNDSDFPMMKHGIFLCHFSRQNQSIDFFLENAGWIWKIVDAWESLSSSNWLPIQWGICVGNMNIPSSLAPS